MTKIKLCGLTRLADIEMSNLLKPDYIGFVFASKSRRYVAPEEAAKLKKALDPAIQAVGVFVDEDPEIIEGLLERGVIDLAQLHGHETEEEIRKMKERTGKPIIRAFRLKNPGRGKPGQQKLQSGTGQTEGDPDRNFAEKILREAENSCADHVLLDAGAGDGEAFDWSVLENFDRPFFLAGGLGLDNIMEAIRRVHPYAVDVSSGIETEGSKDPAKMEAFVKAVREADQDEGVVPLSVRTVPDRI